VTAGLILRFEHRIDRSRGPGGGFLDGAGGLTPRQQLVVAATLTVDGSIGRSDR